VSRRTVIFLVGRPVLLPGGRGIPRALNARTDLMALLERHRAGGHFPFLAILGPCSGRPTRSWLGNTEAVYLARPSDPAALIERALERRLRGRPTSPDPHRVPTSERMSRSMRSH